jgi:hypothetical protein
VCGGAARDSGSDGDSGGSGHRLCLSERAGRRPSRHFVVVFSECTRHRLYFKYSSLERHGLVVVGGGKGGGCGISIGIVVHDKRRDSYLSDMIGVHLFFQKLKKKIPGRTDPCRRRVGRIRCPRRCFRDFEACRALLYRALLIADWPSSAVHIVFAQ